MEGLNLAGGRVSSRHETLGKEKEKKTIGVKEKAKLYTTIYKSYPYI